MRQSSILILALALAGQTGPAQTPADLPVPLKSFLDRNYPEWTFGTVDPESTAFLREKGLFPNLRFGDFNGDGVRDAAVKISQDQPGGRKQTLIALLARENDFIPHVLDSGPESTITYLEVQAKGTEDYDYESEKAFLYAHDTVMLVFDGKASISYLFDDGKFRRVITGD